MKKIWMVCMGVSTVVLLWPRSAQAANALGAAGSITLEGLFIGMAVLGIIVLILMGLLLLARVRELSQLVRKSRPGRVQPKPEDILNMTAAEIGLLQAERRTIH